jgi:hypothetical protein
MLDNDLLGGVTVALMFPATMHAAVTMHDSDVTGLRASVMSFSDAEFDFLSGSRGSKGNRHRSSGERKSKLFHEILLV